MLLDRHLDVLAASPLARAVEPGLTLGANIVRLGVLASDRLGPPVSGVWSTELAGLLRDSVGRFEEDERFVAVVGELVATSRGFAYAWAEDDPGQRNGSIEVEHDVVGAIRLDWVRLPLEDTGGATLVLARGADDTSSRRLRRLEARPAGTP